MRKYPTTIAVMGFGIASFLLGHPQMGWTFAFLLLPTWVLDSWWNYHKDMHE